MVYELYLHKAVYKKSRRRDIQLPGQTTMTYYTYTGTNCNTVLKATNEN